MTSLVSATRRQIPRRHCGPTVERVVGDGGWADRGDGGTVHAPSYRAPPPWAPLSLRGRAQCHRRRESHSGGHGICNDPPKKRKIYISRRAMSERRCCALACPIAIQPPTRRKFEGGGKGCTQTGQMPAKPMQRLAVGTSSSSLCFVFVLGRWWHRAIGVLLITGMPLRHRRKR